MKTSPQKGQTIIYNPENGLELNIPSTGFSLRPGTRAKVVEAMGSSFLLEFELGPNLVWTFLYPEEFVMENFNEE